MTREEAIELLDNLVGMVSDNHDSDYDTALKMAIQALSQEPCDDTVSIRKDVLKFRVGNIVAYNVEWLKKHWQMEMDIVCGVKPCEDAISQNQSNACSILDDECPYPYKHCWECPLHYQYELAKHELDKNVELPSVTQKSGKWIKTTDRLPEDKTYVLTTIKVPNRVAHARSGWYQGGFFHNDNGDTWNSTDREVVAWMPLPTPYEPQERSDKE